MERRRAEINRQRDRGGRGLEKKALFKQETRIVEKQPVAREEEERRERERKEKAEKKKR